MAPTALLRRLRTATMTKRVLEVGNCDADHRAIRAAISRFRAVLDRAHSIDEAIAAIAQRRYDLVLVNRILDATGEEGVECVRRLRDDPGAPSIMLISNYPEAQAQAVAAGALRGFGKASLSSSSTASLLASLLVDADGERETGGVIPSSASSKPGSDARE